MMKAMKFYGSTTVGERGQIVLPAKLRNGFKIKKGDKLLVIGNAETYRIVHPLDMVFRGIPFLVGAFLPACRAVAETS